MKYRRYVLWISHKARVRQTDGQTDGQNNDSQDRASIAASRGNNNHLGTVSVHFTRASVFMIYNGSEFAVFRLYQNRTITQSQQIKMHILNQVQVNLMYNETQLIPMDRNFHFYNGTLQYNCRQMVVPPAE